MMSLRTIKSLSDEAAEQAAQDGKRPYVIFDAEELDRYPPFPFPQLGDHVPHGWQELPDLEMFVDSSGMGADDEAALSLGQFIERLRVLIAEDSGRGFAIGDAGQFQLYVKVYEQF